MFTVAKQKVSNNKFQELYKKIFNSDCKKNKFDTWYLYLNKNRIGFVQVENLEKIAKLCKFGLLKDFRRKGLMSMAFSVILPHYNGKMMACMIPDDNLPCHLFLKNHGFTCVKSPDPSQYMFQKNNKTRPLLSSEVALIGG